MLRHEGTRVSGGGAKAKAGNTEAVGDEMPDQNRREKYRVPVSGSSGV